MAIQFARCQYVSRSSGGNACRKASYNQREEIRCERTGELFSFKERGGNVHHEILLPAGADEKFKNSSVLWNEAEKCEKRKDSQVAREFVIALPDNAEVTLEDRIELTRRFGNIFVERGVAAQIDVHAPHEGEKNWHGHLLVTTRRFSEDGLTFHEKKATDLDPVIRSRTVVEADLWGEVWRDLQNRFFEEKGYEIKVDPIGIVPQEHLGPVRMRHHLNEAVLRARLLEKANEKISQNPLSILEEMTRTQAVFTEKDVTLFLQKHVPLAEREDLLKKVLEHSQTIPLYDKETQEKTGYFTTQSVREEEEKLIRFADNLAKRSSVRLSTVAIEKGLEGRTLSDEQKKAYDLCVYSEKNLSIIQGRAGVGKSYLLDAIRIAHENEGYRVLGLAPTNKVVQDLREEGFEAKTCHSFLFAYKNNRETLDSKTLVVVDEASMLGTALSVELFNVIKNNGAKLVLMGDDRQLSSVERGGTFRFLSDRYGAAELSKVRRQTIGWQKEVSEALAENNVKQAVHLLEEHKALFWSPTKEESFANLLQDWAKDFLLNPHEARQIIAQRNIDVDALNQGARDILRQSGQLGEVEIVCSTQRGRVAFAEGDRIQFTTTDKNQGFMNGSFGKIEKIDLKTKNMTIHLDNGEVKELNPNTYDGLRHGYAATVYKTQGATLSSVYVLHSHTTNQATNYVALTRQTKSLSLYVSQDQTPSTAHLIRQMERQQERGTSLVFDTLKDIEKRNEGKTFLSPVKETAEALVTKIKDKFHRNEDFYQFKKEKTPSQEPAALSECKESSQALEAIYEEMKHPAFNNATIVKKAFEKGLKVHGEEQALAYWTQRKEGFLQTYQETLTKVERELSSPLLNRLTEGWKDEARTLAQQDPGRVLNVLTKVKTREAARYERLATEERERQEKIMAEERAEKERQAHHEHIKDTYLRFKSLYDMLKDTRYIPEPFKEDLKKFSKTLAQDYAFMSHLKLRDEEEAEKIQQLAQSKNLEEHFHSLSRGRGGYSL